MGCAIATRKKTTVLATVVTSTVVFFLVAIAHPIVSCFCHSSYTSGGMNPQSSINAPSWSYYLLLGQSNKKQRRTWKSYSRTNYKRRTKYITHHNLNIIS